MRGRIKHWGIAFLILISQSCKKEASQYMYDIPEGDIILCYEKIQRVSQFLAIELTDIEDSRCPVGVVCCSPGNIALSLRAITQGGSIDTHTLIYDKINMISSDTISNHIIEIVDVTPHRHSNDSIISPHDYRVVIQVNYLLE